MDTRNGASRLLTLVTLGVVTLGAAAIGGVAVGSSSDQTALEASKSFQDMGPEKARRDGPNCPDGEACFWRLDKFNGSKISIDGNSITCCEWRLISGNEEWWRSVKNRFASRKLQIGDDDEVIACMDAGGERETPQRFDRAKIGQVGSTC